MGLEVGRKPCIFCVLGPLVYDTLPREFRGCLTSHQCILKQCAPNSECGASEKRFNSTKQTHCSTDVHLWPICPSPSDLALVLKSSQAILTTCWSWVMFTGSKVLVCNINQTLPVLLELRTQWWLLEPIVPDLSTRAAASLLGWWSIRHPSS